MTSSAVSECFVYITLPGEVAPITAGRFVLDKNRTGIPLGRFVYGRSYLDNPRAVPIDPVELKISRNTYETVQLNGVFGALRDAGPDFWGRRVIEKHAQKSMLGEMDYLLESPDDRAGALGFGLNQTPPAPLRTFNKTLDLEKLQEVAEELIKDEIPNDPAAPQVQDCYFLEPRWVALAPRLLFRTRKGFGSPSSTARTIGGTIPASNTRCCVLLAAAGSPPQEAALKL